jgi:hypothetical protein
VQQVGAIIRSAVELLRRQWGISPVGLLSLLFSPPFLVPYSFELEHVAWRLLVDPVFILELLRSLLYRPDGSEQL